MGGATEHEIDPRVRSAWRTWLAALATDAAAAMAAALAYESLPDQGRDAWLDALETDSPTLDVPKVALYAPLLAVEVDEARRSRIETLLATDDTGLTPAAATRASRGVAADGKHVCMIVSPLYLDFVQVLVCHYTPAGGFFSVRHDPLRHSGEFPLEQSKVDDVATEPTPLRVVVEELAHAILADRRNSREAPPALASFAHLFGPHLDDSDRLE